MTTASIKDSKFSSFRPYDYVIVGLDTDDTDTHPLYDPRIKMALVPSVIRNFAMYGVLKPVRYTLIDGKPYTVDGRQRVRYARAVWDLQEAQGIAEADRILVPGIKTSGDDATLFGISRAANLSTQDGAMTTSHNVRRMLAMTSRNYAQVADTFGVTEQTVRNWESMGNLAPDIVAKMEDNEISATAALQLSWMTAEMQTEILTELEGEGKDPTVENVQRKKKEKTGQGTMSAKARVDAAIAAILKGVESDADYLETMGKAFKALTDKTIKQYLADAKKEEKAEAEAAAAKAKEKEKAEAAKAKAKADKDAEKAEIAKAKETAAKAKETADALAAAAKAKADKAKAKNAKTAN